MRVKVCCKPGDNPKSEYVNKLDYEGEHKSLDEGIAAWKSLNGLDGIGVDTWPVEAVEIKPEKPSKPITG